MVCGIFAIDYVSSVMSHIHGLNVSSITFALMCLRLRTAVLLTEHDDDYGLGLALALDNMVLNLANISGKQYFKDIAPALTV